MKNHNTSKRLIRARVPGSIRLKAPARVPQPARAKKAPRFEWPMTAWTTAAVSIGLAAALFAMLSWPSSRDHQVAESVRYNLPGARTDANRIAPARDRTAALPVRAPAARPTVRNAPVAEPATAPADPPPVGTSAAASVPEAAPVTMTGCLEANDDSFRLKDPVGAEAPTSRSWRSGFLKKRPASIAVVDDASRLGLPNYVGQRVAATGLLTNREMQVRSVRRLAASCG